MIYALLRAVAGIALRWYYAAVTASGVDRIPRRGPLLVVVNHPNALVDALVVGWVLPRRLLLTAKATLFANPIADRLLRWTGVVPLRRAQDAQPGSGPLAVARNTESFRAVSDRLGAGGAVLIFPEGKSHDEPALAPMRTGAARIALEASRQAGVKGLVVLPIGLHFERKEQPGTRVLAQVGDAIAMDEWRAADAQAPVAELTQEIDRRLRAVTLNFASRDEASRMTALAGSLARLFADAEPSLGTTPSLEREVALARYLERARGALGAGDESLHRRADDFVERLVAFERELDERGIAFQDLSIGTGVLAGTRFVLREGGLVAIAGPVALWGAANHYLPFHAARALAMRRVESASDPAMRTIVAGAALVLLFYGMQTLVVGSVLGAFAAVLYAASLPVAAEVNFALGARLARARRRAHAYIRFRRVAGEQERLRAELAAIRHEALSLDASLDARAAAGERSA